MKPAQAVNTDKHTSAETMTISDVPLWHTSFFSFHSDNSLIDHDIDQSHIFHKVTIKTFDQ